MRGAGVLRNVTTCDKDGEGVKKIMKFVWRNLWMAPNGPEGKGGVEKISTYSYFGEGGGQTHS